jgi:hypothetical protein
MDRVHEEHDHPDGARFQQQYQPCSSPIAARPLRLVARWLSSRRSASVRMIVLLIKNRGASTSNAGRRRGFCEARHNETEFDANDAR